MNALATPFVFVLGLVLVPLLAPSAPVEQGASQRIELAAAILDDHRVSGMNK